MTFVVDFLIDDIATKDQIRHHHETIHSSHWKFAPFGLQLPNLDSQFSCRYSQSKLYVDARFFGNSRKIEQQLPQTCQLWGNLLENFNLEIDPSWALNLDHNFTITALVKLAKHHTTVIHNTHHKDKCLVLYRLFDLNMLATLATLQPMVTKRGREQTIALTGGGKAAVGHFGEVIGLHIHAVCIPVLLGVGRVVVVLLRLHTLDHLSQGIVESLLHTHKTTTN